MAARLSAHPRLYVSREQLDRLREPVPALLAAASRKVAAAARSFVRDTAFEYDRTTHNAHLIRARIMQNRVVSLLVEHFRTEKEAFRDAALKHLFAMDGWAHWSWIAERAGDNHPNDIFDLSYGENAATLALGFDWLHNSLSKRNRAALVNLARRRALVPFLKNTEPRNRSWWFGKPDTNWNTVCAGGAGLLALAMAEYAPEAREVIRRAEISIAPFYKLLRATGGGWPEGLGYWNYGMRYGFMYLLARERATGRRHPLLEQPATRATLFFPLDFCPRGVPSSFGDVNRWSPLPFHYAAAARLKVTELYGPLDAALAEARTMSEIWPDAAELLVLHPRRAPAQRHTARGPIAKRYLGLDWCLLADAWPNPALYAAIRGGTTEVPHGHRDLLSFHLHADGEALVNNIGCEEYLDTTFSGRRYELFETTAPSKNTILLNGVGIAGNSTVKTEIVRLGKYPGVRIDATQAMGSSRNGNAAAFCGRLFLLLGSDGLLVVDRIETKFPARMESRMHTFARVKVAKHAAILSGKRARLNVAYACDVPAVLCTAIGAPTAPGQGATMLRWCTQGRGHTAVTFATLLARGKERAKVAITPTKHGVKIVACGKRVRLDHRLQF